MTFRKALSTFVIVSLIAAAVPAQAWASEGAEATHQATPANLRASIDRAAVRLAHEQRLSTARPQARAERTAAASQTGGGSGRMVAVMLIGTIASAAAGYVIYKQMKKTSEQAAGQ